jgi:hypothetical protein
MSSPEEITDARERFRVAHLLEKAARGCGDMEREEEAALELDAATEALREAYS